MPNVVVAIAVEAYYFVAATLAKGGIGAFLLRAGGSTLLSVATSKLFAPKIPAEQIGLVSQQVMVRSGIEHRTIGYGQVVTSGPVVYNNVQGTNNEYLWYQVAMLDGESDDLVEVRFDKQVIPKADINWTPGTGGADGTGDGDVSTAEFIGESAQKAVKIFYYLGDAAQPVCGELATAFTEIDSNHRLRGVTHLVARLQYDSNTESVWQSGPPQSISAVWKATKVYDPRLDSTNGGAGTHRYTDPSTWEWSDTPALCAAHYLVAVMGVDPASKINWQSVADAADDCETLVAIPTAATEKRFTCNGVVSLGAAHRDNLDAIASSMDGKITYSGGTWTIRASVWEVSSVSFGENDLVGDIEVRGSAPESERFNLIRGVFIDPSQGYEPVDFAHVSSATYLARDNGTELSYDMVLPMTNSETMAQRIAFRNLEQSDNQRIVSLTTNLRGLKAAVGDVVDLTIFKYGWTAKDFRVIEWNRNADSTVSMKLREDFSVSYDDPAEGEYGTGALGVISDTPDIVPAPTGLTALTTINGVELQWSDPPLGSYDHIEIWVSYDNSRANATLLDTTPGTPYVDNSSTISRQRYYWIRAVSALGFASEFEPITTTTTAVAYPRNQQAPLIPDPFIRLGSTFWDLSGCSYVAGVGLDSTDVIRCQLDSVARNMLGDARRGPREWDAQSAGTFDVEVRFRMQMSADPNSSGVGAVFPTVRISDENEANPQTFTNSAQVEIAADDIGNWYDFTGVVSCSDTGAPPRFIQVGLTFGINLLAPTVDVDFIDARIIGRPFAGADQPGLVPNPVTEAGKFLSDDGTWKYDLGDVRNYGAVGNGTTDDATALQAAIDDAELNGFPLTFEKGKDYKINTGLTSTGNIVINGNGATLKPASTESGLVVNPGADIASTTLSADAQINTNQYQVTSAASFAKGALVKLVSSAAWHYDPDAEGLKKGELSVIKEVAGTTIEQDDILYDNYDVSAETVTATVLASASLILRDLNVKYDTPTNKVGIQAQNIINGLIHNCHVDGAQIQGINLDQCYGMTVERCKVYRANDASSGYGVQLNECTKCNVINSDFWQCRRGVDFSGLFPSRLAVVTGCSVDGSGDDSAASPLPSNSGSSGFGSHETCEHTIFRNNIISNVRTGILARGPDTLIEGNYFVGDINNQCILSSKVSNVTIQNNTYAANLRPEKTLDVVATDDDQQKCPWFVRFIDPASDVGFYRVLNNSVDGVKNALVMFTMTTSAPVDPLKNFIIRGNVGNLDGSTLDTTVYILASNDQPFDLEDSIILDNSIRRNGVTLTEYQTAGGSAISIDYENTVEIDNYKLPDTVLTETTSGTEANITKNHVDIQMTIRDGVVSLVGYVDFDINAGTAASVVKLQNLPSKATVGGTYGPALAVPFVEGVATGSVGTQGMICSPVGVSGSIPTSLWLSYDKTAYNTVWPIANDYRVPIDISYYTERRRV